MTISWALLPIIDGFMGALTAPGMTKDATGSIPSRYAGNTVYAGPLNQTAVGAGTGELDEVTFRFRVVWSIAAVGEDGGLVRRRPVSDAVDAGVDLVATTVVANRSMADLWEQLRVDSVTHDAFGQFDCRGVYIDLTGWRIVG
jgi:hypothetical protein